MKYALPFANFTHLLMSLYRPEKDTAENTRFNYYVLRVRIRSEHCVGFLKGRWSSLRGLRCAIDNAEGLQYATLWATTCIHLHAFAMDHKDGIYISKDRFFRKGKRLMRKERQMRKEWLAHREEVGQEAEQEEDDDDDIGLLEGKIKREGLKKELFAYLDAEDDMME